MLAKPRSGSTPLENSGKSELDCLGLSEVDVKAAQEELEILMLEQSMLDELLAQEELQKELCKLNDDIECLNDIREHEKSLLNSTVPASSDLAPSTLPKSLFRFYTMDFFMWIFLVYQDLIKPDPTRHSYTIFFVKLSSLCTSRSL